MSSVANLKSQENKTKQQTNKKQQQQTLKAFTETSVLFLNYKLILKIRHPSNLPDTWNSWYPFSFDEWTGRPDNTSLQATNTVQTHIPYHSTSHSTLHNNQDHSLSGKLPKLFFPSTVEMFYAGGDCCGRVKSATVSCDVMLLCTVQGLIAFHPHSVCSW